MKYFNEIVGLRIYLALWVAIGHGLQLSGYSKGKNVVTGFLLSGHDAVAVFMIVSGFVITNLLISRQETYARYITRRFFRLYPGFVVACVIGYFLTDDWVHIVDAVPWHGAYWTGYAATVRALNDQVVVNFWPYFALHAIMLHGAVPAQILDRSALTFLPAAWSISLEWQFYLIAPLVVVALRRGWSTALMLAVGLVAFAAYRHGLLGTFQTDSSLASNWPYFAVGMASRLGYDRLARLTVPPLAAAAMVLATCAILIRAPLPYAIWGMFLALSLWRHASPLLTTIFDRAFTSGPALLLGEASYSLYLIHRPVQVVLGATALDVMSLDKPLMLAVQIGAIVIAVPISLLMYFWIERPGIRLGSVIAGRLPAAKTATPVAAVVGIST